MLDTIDDRYHRYCINDRCDRYIYIYIYMYIHIIYYVIYYISKLGKIRSRRRVFSNNHINDDISGAREIPDNNFGNSNNINQFQ